MNITRSKPYSKHSPKPIKLAVKQTDNFNLPLNEGRFMIAILKYNAGNIKSVQNALTRLGYKSIITDNPSEL
jgi:hypothetical protein